MALSTFRLVWPTTFLAWPVKGKHCIVRSFHEPKISPCLVEFNTCSSGLARVLWSCKLACFGQWWASALPPPLLLHHLLCAAQERGLPLHGPCPPASGNRLCLQLQARSILLSSTGQDGQSHNGVRRITKYSENNLNSCST